MNARRLAFALAALAVIGCRTPQGPVTLKTEERRVDGEDLKKQGEKLLRDGLALEDEARKLRADAAEDRRTADTAETKGQFDRATQLRLQANERETEATQKEYQGRDMELRGGDFLNRGDAAIRKDSEPASKM
jgi:hypothetical protein